MVGDRRAREILMLCEEIPAALAAEWGLVNYVVPRAELDAKVDELVEKLAAKLPQTMRYTKQQLNWWRDISWHETIGHARDWLSLSMLNDEASDATQEVSRVAALELELGRHQAKLDKPALADHVELDGRADPVADHQSR